MKNLNIARVTARPVVHDGKTTLELVTWLATNNNPTQHPILDFALVIEFCSFRAFVIVKVFEFNLLIKVKLGD